jgi:VWFA-related protein
MKIGLALTAVILLAATSYLASGGLSQDPPPQQPASAQQPTSPQPPTFRTEANYVRVDAYPTKDGAPVTDLTRDDFEVLENGQRQQLEQFERVLIRAAGPQETRVEPNTVAESRSMLESSRARVFVLFLDTYHVDIGGSHAIAKPLVDALDRVIGQDDLIGVMTPEMSPDDMAFARKTTTIQGILERYWYWGDRDKDNPVDPEDRQYGSCYPNQPPQSLCADQNGVAAEMIDRRHEKRTLDALQDLVRYLRGVREERKAILAVSNGWLLFKPNYRLMRPLNCEAAPTGPGVRIGPRNGKLTTKDPAGSVASSSCGIDRVNLAQIDDDREFRDILDEANRANASFYPIDPRGLAVFDTPLMRSDVPGPPPPVTPPSVDQAMLKQRVTSLRTLAEATDGLAVAQSNDLAGGFRRIVNDLSSYYLLGYYSNGKLDGKFHAITVRVKRPGVQVRARRGYLAATTAEVTRATRATAASAPPSPIEAEALAVEAALRPLGSFGRETSLRLRAASSWNADGRPQVWVVGELGTADTWRLGAEADVTLTREEETLATAHATVPAGARTFRVTLTPQERLTPGDYSLSVHTRATSMLATSGDLLPLPLPAPPDVYGSLIVRRGPFTGLKEVPTADLRFRRSEQMRIEVPAPGSSTPLTSARLLDRNGKAMAVPVATAFRDDGEGVRWVTAQVPLTPLGVGDYIVEIAIGDTRTLTPFRIVP